jgi:hypothetical protein
MGNKINLVKVLSLDSEGIKLEDGYYISSSHETECCEYHWLDFDSLDFNEIEDAIFDFSKPWFEKVEDYGIRLLPVNMHPIAIPGYGSNNGYYSSNLTLNLKTPTGYQDFDISECQEINE